MSKYDNLDARKELEQTITEDLIKALEKRGFTIRHNGTRDSHAPAGMPDIEVWNNYVHINVEITKSTKSAQDREWQSIKAHFKETKKNNSTKKCFVWFISPQTYYRTTNSIKDWNFMHKEDNDQKFLPICFSTFELFMKKLRESPENQYQANEILILFDFFVQFLDDENILRLFFEQMFSSDSQLKDELERKEEERHQRVVKELISGFKQLEQKLREERIALSTDAIKNVIHLIFIKLYEEKKEKEEQERNRFTQTSFQDYQAYVRDNKTAVHKLFANIKNDPELRECGLLTADDNLSKRMKDNFVIENFIKPFEKYVFYTTKVDGLGAAYEVLGQLSGKDVKVGQFFTPENVVKFMVKLAELHPSDIVHDPACGTSRFLTHSMEDMINKAKGMRGESEKVENIQKNQLFGTDDDPTVAKLAKMNMYIHGDGKTNIKDEDGLTNFGMDGKADVILTNPPLGDLSYQRSIYDDDFKLNRMEVIPQRNITQDKLLNALKKLEEWEKKLSTATSPKQAKKLKKRLEYWENKKMELEYAINQDNSKFVVSGKQMKGGALFLNASKHYLKDIRDNSAPYEWKGGKLLIILDEGNLNTETYSQVRDFIKKHFFIKAIISLTRDAFVPVARTNTKTSILYAIKKPDSDVIQREPVFFAYVDKVGIDTRKRVCANHLFNEGNDILSKYFDFKEKILASYSGFVFSPAKFASQQFKGGVLDESYYYIKYPEKIGDRLDENYNNPKFDVIDTILQETEFDVITIGDKDVLVDITSGTTPKGIYYLEDEGIPFLGATQIIDGHVFVETAPRIPEEFHRGVLKESQIKKGDILITIAGTYIGRCAVFQTDEECNCNQAVAILRINTDRIIPEFLVQYLNSEIGQLFFGKLQHISNQSNINTTEITKIKVILPQKPEQEKVLKMISKKESKLDSLQHQINELKKQKDKIITDFYGYNS